MIQGITQAVGSYFLDR